MDFLEGALNAWATSAGDIGDAGAERGQQHGDERLASAQRTEGVVPRCGLLAHLVLQ